MKKLTVKVNDVAYIVITGPTQCGKSIVMDRIAKVLRKEFGSTVASEDLRVERNLTDYDNLDSWQKQIVNETVWVLKEAPYVYEPGSDEEEREE